MCGAKKPLKTAVKETQYRVKDKEDTDTIHIYNRHNTYEPYRFMEQLDLELVLKFGFGIWRKSLESVMNRVFLSWGKTPTNVLCWGVEWLKMGL